MIPCAQNDYQEKLQKHIGYAFTTLQKFSTKMVSVCNKTSPLWRTNNACREAIWNGFQGLYTSRIKSD